MLFIPITLSIYFSNISLLVFTSVFKILTSPEIEEYEDFWIFECTEIFGLLIDEL